MLLDLDALFDIHGALLRADFGQFCEAVLAPFGQKPAAHHQLMIRELQRLAETKDGRLMLFLPPGSAKSTYASVLFPAWFMAQRSRQQVIGASNGAMLASDFSRKVQSVVRDMTGALGYGLQTEAVDLWRTTNNCQYRAVGIGGVVTGFRGDLALIDDPIRSAEEAASETIREKTWNWFNADLVTRLKPGGRICLVQTRWHQDDLGGRLLNLERDDWRIICLPARAREEDALGREPGEWLWEGSPYADLLRAAYKRLESNGGLRFWGALYDQDPRPEEGSLFKTRMIDLIAAEPAGGQVARAWDLASTKQSGKNDPDFTAGVKLARMPDGALVVLDVVRDRGGPDDVEAWIVNTAKADTKTVRIGLPQDPGQAGKTQVLYLTRKLMGFRVESSPETGDKETRAAPVAAQVNVGNMKIAGLRPDGTKLPWVDSFLDELAAFPFGTKDDQVDALSRAFMMVGMGRSPIVFTAADLARI